MGALNPFKKPKMPGMGPLPKTPGPSDAEIAKAQQAELERMRKQRGRAATMMATGDDGAGIATKKLLGG